MPLQFIRNDITKMSVDAIVNATNTSLLGGGGVDGCIHRSGAAASGILLSDISESGERKWPSVGGLSVDFPGIYGYPKDQALKVAVDIISAFLLENEMMVYIVIFDLKANQISGKLFADIAAYIDDRYVEEHTYRQPGRTETAA